MFKFFQNSQATYHYSKESLKNRYPCKIIGFESIYDNNKTTKVKCYTLTRNNTSEYKLPDLLENVELIEKFNPYETIRFGWLSANELVLKKAKTLEEARGIFKKITEQMIER